MKEHRNVCIDMRCFVWPSVSKWLKAREDDESLRELFQEFLEKTYISEMMETEYFKNNPIHEGDEIFAMKYANWIEEKYSHIPNDFEKIGFSRRTSRALCRAGIETLEELKSRIWELPSLRNIGAHSIAEIVAKVNIWENKQKGEEK